MPELRERLNSSILRGPPWVNTETPGAGPTRGEPPPSPSSPSLLLPLPGEGQQHRIFGWCGGGAVRGVAGQNRNPQAFPTSVLIGLFLFLFLSLSGNVLTLPSFCFFGFPKFSMSNIFEHHTGWAWNRGHSACPDPCPCLPRRDYMCDKCRAQGRLSVDWPSGMA